MKSSVNTTTMYVIGTPTSSIQSYKKWLSEIVGKRHEDWSLLPSSGWYELRFKREEDATAFKLRFAI